MRTQGEENKTLQEKLHEAIASMNDEWLLIEQINLQDDTFEILQDNLYKIGIPIPKEGSYSQQNLEIQKLIAEEYQEERMRFCCIENLRKSLKQMELVEYEYISIAGENAWRRDLFKVAEWDEAEPKIVNWFHMNSDPRKANEAKQRQAIREAYLQSEQAYTIKNMYLKRLNQELQIPINMIVGNAAVARAFSTKPESVNDCIDGISISAKSIFRMVRQMINMDAIQEGTLLLDLKQTSLENLWKNTLEIVRPSMKLRRHNVHVDTAQMYHHFIIGDVQKLQQILLNLLQNAIDYTPYRGEIFFGIKESPIDREYGYFDFYVQDNGIGMTEEFRKIMFEPFAREYSTRIERVEGSGLGLMIVQDLVRLLDGEIDVKTECGKGTTITVRLKLKYGDGKTSGIGEKQYYDWEEWKHCRHMMPRFAGQRVLIVDSDDMTAAIEKEILSDQGLLVERAINGEDALYMFQNVPENYYDLILLDMELPYTDGYATMMGIRQLREDGKKIPIITLSSRMYDDKARTEEENKLRLEKPVSAKQLITSIQKYIK